MADERYIPKRTLSFLAHTAVIASKHGLRAGVGKAAAKVSPPLLVIEAAYSVLSAVKSFFDLGTAHSQRDSVLATNEALTEQLRLAQERLGNEIDLARREMDHDTVARGVIARVTKECQALFAVAMSAYRLILSQDLPTLESVENEKENLEAAWETLRHALLEYQTSGEGA